MNPLLLLLVLALSLLSGACAQKGLYEWGAYEGDIYKLYKSPESEPAFRDHLKTLIDTARKKGRKVPPGVAAEYAFLQYTAGQYDAAIEYFDLERRTWPESGTLMTKIIERIEIESSEDGDEKADSPEADSSEKVQSSSKMNEEDSAVARSMSEEVQYQSDHMVPVTEEE